MPVSSPSNGPAPVSQSIPSNFHASYTASGQRSSLSQPPQLELSPPALQQPAQSQQAQRQPEPPVQAATPQKPQQPSDVMDIDSKEPVPSSTKKEKGTATAPSSKAPSPKPGRATKEAPPLPQGSGLITNALFGGADDSKSPDARSTPNIIVHVPLQKGNQIVNFAQLAEEQYGFAALHPRLAAHKERLARVAAAGAALERNDKGKSAGESAEEDLSLDVDRDSDMDGDITMGGAGTGTNGAPSEASDGKKRRRKKVEEYDRDDPFVDDSEMAWQEQAAASKDGFFVYSGPLVPEGDKVQVERLVFYLLLGFLDHKLTHTVRTEQSNAVVVAVEEQVEVEPWLHTHTSPSPQQSRYPKTQAYPSAAQVQEAVPRADPAGPKKRMRKSTNGMGRRRRRRMRVVVVVEEGLVVAGARVLVVESLRQRLLRLRMAIRLSCR